MTRLIELCFQTAGIGEIGTSGRMALPLRADRVSTLRRPDPVVDGEGNLYVTLSGYRTVELPGGVDAERLAPLRRLGSAIDVH